MDWTVLLFLFAALIFILYWNQEMKRYDKQIEQTKDIIEDIKKIREKVEEINKILKVFKDIPM